MSPRPQLGEFVQTDWSAQRPSLPPLRLSHPPFTPLQFGAGERASVGAAWRVWLALRDLLEPGAISFDSLIETSRHSPRSCHRGSDSKRGGVEVTRDTLMREIPHTNSCTDSAGGPQRGRAWRGGPVSLSSVNETPSDVCVRWNQLNNACRNALVFGVSTKTWKRASKWMWSVCAGGEQWSSKIQDRLQNADEMRGCRLESLVKRGPTQHSSPRARVDKCFWVNCLDEKLMLWCLRHFKKSNCGPNRQKMNTQNITTFSCNKLWITVSMKSSYITWPVTWCMWCITKKMWLSIFCCLLHFTIKFLSKFIEKKTWKSAY